MSNPNWISNSPSLYVQSDGQSCERFFANFFRDTRHFVLRATGGCADMNSIFYPGLDNLRLALDGGDNSLAPRFSGFCLFGGTRMIKKLTPSVVVPGITEVFPALRQNCPDARILGIVAKAGHLRTTIHGIVVADEPGADFATIIHPQQDSVLLLQPNVDHKADWNAEWQRCLEMCESHASNNWQGLLLVYSGGKVTENELLAWAELGLDNPFYRVLLVRHSGGVADKYCELEAFVRAHPNVHICDNRLSSMRAKLFELGAII